ncbi:hypothetical protein BY996DRAFT_6509506 [Phakopsora pachyrhizi]|nr:hypothetical protein BY996DRAFT_6509506 [Phakopsora pachyrhizi]
MTMRRVKEVPSGTTESSSTHLSSSSSTTTSFILKIALCSTQMSGESPESPQGIGLEGAILMGSQRRQKSGVKEGGGSEEEILDKALAFCSRLERLGFNDGQMYPSRLLSVLPFTLKEIEILDGPSEWEGPALFGLEKIGIRRNNSSRIRGGTV